MKSTTLGMPFSMLSGFFELRSKFWRCHRVVEIGGIQVGVALRATSFCVLFFLAHMTVAGASAQEHTQIQPANASGKDISAEVWSPTGYRVLRQYDIGGEGDWDYLTIDSEARRLYVTHESQVEVLDADTGKSVGRIEDKPGIHGVAIATEFRRGFISNGRNKTVKIFDSSTLTPIKTVQLRSGADFILYEPVAKRVFAFNEKTTVLEGQTGDVAGSVELEGEPEAAVADGNGTVFVNISDKHFVAVIDSKTLSIKKTYPVACRSPHSLSYDATHERLLIGCRDGFWALDAKTGKVAGETLICSNVDASGFDADSGLVFESCSEGVVSLIREVSPNCYTLVESIPTQLWAKTMVFDPKTKNIYLPTADYELFLNTSPNALDPYRVKIKPGSFRVLVVGKP